MAEHDLERKQEQDTPMTKVKVPRKKRRPVVDEAARIQIAQILEKFQTNNEEVHTFENELSNFERGAVHELCRKMGMISKSKGKGVERRVSVFKSVAAKINHLRTKNDTTKNDTAKNDTSTNVKAKKVKAKVVKAENEIELSKFMFSEDSKVVLHDLFTYYPPVEGETGQYLIAKPSAQKDKEEKGRSAIFFKPLMNKALIARKVDILASKRKKDRTLKKISQIQKKLPIASFKDAIISAIASHQVVLISGETGCGKTTQVPQYILDYMWSKGEACKIICTQPRRISATSVSERISAERGEHIGSDIGYKIRMECRGGRNTSVVFCTNGVLLRVLVSRGNSRLCNEASIDLENEDISGITHILVDEVHERDCNSDLMLTIIRDILPTHPNLRLILMSATLDAERFSKYFGGCPVIRVPGFTYPVKTYYLEDILSIVKAEGNNHLNSGQLSSLNADPVLTEEEKVALDEAIDLAWSTDEFDVLLDLISINGTRKVCNYQHSSTLLTPLMVFAGKGRVQDVCMLLSFGADCHLRAKDGTTALQLAERESQAEAAEVLSKQTQSDLSESLEEQQLLNQYLAKADPDNIDVDLVVQLMKKICVSSKEGAILVFLPGWEEINKTREKLLTVPMFQSTSKFLILSLHSMVPAMDQKNVFKRPPEGCRKIVLSTNIAESAITIDDVVYVIDSGRMKEKSYDPYSNVSTLQSSWVTKANAKQREGRAGRCQPGVCYHLFSRLREASFPDFQLPEIKRMPIEELCLQVKLLDRDCKIEDFLMKTLDSPAYETIQNALIILEEIGALTSDEKLTELGEKIALLPIPPVISKMLFFAILMNCLDPALTLACAANYREPFTLPIIPSEKIKADDARKKFSEIYGGQSDHLAVIGAFEGWKEAKQNKEERRFCDANYLSSSTMVMLEGMRQQLKNELQRQGFILDDVSSYSLNARDFGILHAVIVAGLYPMVGRLIPPLPRTAVSSRIETSGSIKVRLGRQSINSKLTNQKRKDCPLIIYNEITRTDFGMSIRKCSIVGPLPVLLFASEIAVMPREDKENNTFSDMDEVDDENGVGTKFMSSPCNSVTLIADRWLFFPSRALDSAQIYLLKQRLSEAIMFRITRPRDALPPVLGATVYAISRILSYDGLSGRTPPVEGKSTSESSAVGANEVKSTSESSAGGANKVSPTSESSPDGEPTSETHQYMTRSKGPAPVARLPTHDEVIKRKMEKWKQNKRKREDNCVRK